MKTAEDEIPKVLGGSVNPYKRSILFNPKLVLYINQPSWKSAFCSPRYPVVLGRSQDLFTYKSVKIIKLVSSEKAYFEHTLAPYRMALKTGRGYVILMPQFLDYNRSRAPKFARYVVLSRRVFTDELIKYENSQPETYWIDPESIVEKGMQLGLFFHSFVGNEND